MAGWLISILQLFENRSIPEDLPALTNFVSIVNSSVCIIVTLFYLPCRKKRQNLKKSGESNGTKKIKGQNSFNGWALPKVTAPAPFLLAPGCPSSHGFLFNTPVQLQLTSGFG